MLQARRRDENETPIVNALKAIGAVVCRLNDFGVPDLLVGYRGRTILLEVKNPAKTSKAHGKKDRVTEDKTGQLTDKQVEWWRDWIGGEAYIVFTPEEAVAAVRGVDLPAGLMVMVSDSIVIGSEYPVPLNPAQAIALGGALYEAAGIAKARRAEVALDNELSK